MNEEIPSAEQFIKTLYGLDSVTESIFSNPQFLSKDLIEFAKLHVEKALKAANKNVTTKSYFGDLKKDVKEGKIKVVEIQDDGRVMIIDPNSILNAYPLENIK